MRKMLIPADYIGQKHNLLAITDMYKKGEWWYVLCDCECGRQKEIFLNNVLDGKTKSCGCLSGRIHKGKERHGGCKDYKKTRLYGIWHGMKSRCKNPNHNSYENYGGRGIKLCDEWTDDFISFEAWAVENGYTDDLTIDRIDNDGDYTPDNCKWSTRMEQQQNRREYKPRAS